MRKFYKKVIVCFGKQNIMKGVVQWCKLVSIFSILSQLLHLIYNDLQFAEIVFRELVHSGSDGRPFKHPTREVAILDFFCGE